MMFLLMLENCLYMFLNANFEVMVFTEMLMVIMMLVECQCVIEVSGGSLCGSTLVIIVVRMGLLLIGDQDVLLHLCAPVLFV